MSKRKEGIKELRLIGAAMADMEIASELGQLNDKVSHTEQPSPSLRNQGQQHYQSQSPQQAKMQRAQLFEQQAQQAKEGEQQARHANDLT
ncbi:MAG TPA: hypothetical protein DD730_18870 [Desulfosporosinus sp.]|jgi:hypothetical protein|nr:hypothetical protein [Desulfosporosinus sp.]